jgi:hypothetical protein
MKPTYDELEEIAALATALTLSTRNRERDAIKDDVKHGCDGHRDGNGHPDQH